MDYKRKLLIISLIVCAFLTLSGVYAESVDANVTDEIVSEQTVLQEVSTNDLNDGQLTAQDDEEPLADSVVYFNASATEDGDGSYSSPYKYVKEDRITNGVTAFFADGVYEIDCQIALDPGYKVTLVGQSSQNTILDPNYYYGFVVNGTSSLGLKDLTILESKIYNFGEVIAENVIFEDNIGTSYGMIYSAGSQYLSNLYLRNCQFTNNYAPYHGAAVTAFNSVINIYNCTFYNSSAGGYGGAIYATNSDLRIFDSQFYDSEADNGGVIYCDMVNLYLDNCVIDSCKSNRFGGAIYAVNSSLRMYNSDLSNGNAEYGGMVYCENCIYTSISNCTFDSAQAKSFGGVLALESSPLLMELCSFSNYNSLNDGGGAIYIIEGEYLQVTNSSFVNGHSNFGGAICALSTNSYILYNEFINNSASYWGGSVLTMYGVVSIAYNDFIQSSAGTHGGAVLNRLSETLYLIDNRFMETTAPNGPSVFIDGDKQKVDARGNVNLDGSVVIEYGHLYNLERIPSSVSLFNYTPEQSDLPSRYDSRDYGYVTPVKDQKEGGNCWAFSGIATLEACIKKATGITYDFSEENAKNLMAEYFILSKDTESNEGGNRNMFVSYLNSWFGPVYDELDPYDDHSTLSLTYDPLLHIQNVNFLPDGDQLDINVIKKAIMDYGAVTVSTIWDGEEYHAVSLIGWDDNYNGPDCFNISSKGVWIFKNSWGEEWGDNGFSNMSYDRFIYDLYTFILAPDRGYTEIYQYDYGGLSTFNIFNGTEVFYYKNKFISHGNDILSAVSTYFYEPVNYTVSIYLNGKSVTNQSGSSFAGYCTIPLLEEVYLSAGDEFEVEIKTFANDDTNWVPVCKADSLNEITFAENMSFISFDGLDWRDLYTVFSTGPRVACIKAFTRPANVREIGITVDKFDTVEANRSVIINVNLESYLSQGSENNLNGLVMFTINGKYYYAQAKNGKAALNVTFDKFGTYNLTAQYRTNLEISKVASFSFKVIPDNITFSISDVVKYYGGFEQFIATVYNNNVPLADRYVDVTIVGDRTYTVKTNSNGKIRLDLKQKPGNYTFITSYGEASKTSKVTVMSTIDAGNASGVYLNSEYSAAFFDTDGEPLKNTEVIIKIGDEDYYPITDSNGIVTQKVDFDAGNYSVVIINPENSEQKRFNLEISKADPAFSFTSAQDDHIVTITVNFLNATLTGQCSVDVEGAESKSADIENGKATFEYIKLESGNHDVTVHYSGDDNYESADISGNITVEKVIYTITVQNVTAYYGDVSYSARVTISERPVSRETVIFTIDNKPYTSITDSNGVAVINLDYGVGSYDVLVQCDEFNATSNLAVKSTIDAKDATGEYSNSKVSAKFLDTSGNALVSGNVIFKIGSSSYLRTTDSNGVATADINLNAGNYTVTAINNINKEQVQFGLSISKITPEMSFEVAQSNGIVKITTVMDPLTVTGNLNYTEDGKTRLEKLENGRSTYTYSYLTPGDYVFERGYMGDVNYNPISYASVKFTVSSPILTAGSVSLVYGTTKYFTVSVNYPEGGPVYNKKVTIVVDGKSYRCTYYGVTGTDGKVSINCNTLIPDTYTVRITSDYCKDITSKITVSKATPKLSASKKTFKLKSTKKYTVTLKSNLNKVLKSKKITLKVKGKTYSAKTNSNGKATFNLKVLKKRGTFTAVVKFGDNCYNTVTKKVKITVR